MARLEYDEGGSTLYFIVSFYGIVLLPVTYFLWPRKSDDGRGQELVCHCEPCRQKRLLVEVDSPKRRFKNIVRVGVLVALWVVFAVLAYSAATMERDYTEYDPFAILELDTGASMSEIRKKYREMSKLYHPDKEGGDQQKFVRIAKAYEALTDDTSRENWEKYGNPDGPQAASFGIALPSWIVDKQNSFWVLGLYLAVFVIVLPTVVGLWWYKSIKYSHSNILLQTTQIFKHFLIRTHNLPIKRILMILTAAMEFEPHSSKLLKGHSSDNEELSELIKSKQLLHIDIKTREVPFSTPYATKARILTHAYLEKLELPSSSLLADQRIVVKKCPQLLGEMLNSLTEIWAYTKYSPPQQRRGIATPSLDTFENVMRLSQMLVQALWDRQSSLLQLPHLQPDQLRHFKTRKRNINTIEQFAAMANGERRALVRSISDEAYLDMLAVCAGFPHIDVEVSMEVVDDEEPDRVTAGSLVTFNVTLIRKGLLNHYNVSMEQLLETASLSQAQANSGPEETMDGAGVETLGAEGVAGGGEKGRGGGARPWDKQQLRRRKRGKAAPSKVKKKPPKKKKQPASPAPPETAGQAEEEEEGRGEERGGEGETSSDDDKREDDDGSVSGEEKEWSELQKAVKKKKKNNQSSTKSHEVHAPYFPEEKQEGWWLYIADRKRKEVLCPPQRVSGLQDEHTADLQLMAPEAVGMVRYTVVLMSDSYLDLYFQKELKFTVHEKKEVSGKEQWKELEEEEEEEEAIEESGAEETASEETDSEEESDNY